MKLLMCHCYQCKLGRYNWRPMIRGKRKGARRAVRRLLQIGNYDLPMKVYVGYTD